MGCADAPIFLETEEADILAVGFFFFAVESGQTFALGGQARLEASAGNSLIRVNLLLTGIIFSGDTRDKISFEGPPFNNECLKTDIFDVETYGLLDMKYPYPLDADRPAIREFFASPWR